MSSTLEVTVNLVNDKMHFHGHTPTRGPLDIDYVPPYGDNLGYMPLEMFLMSLSACSGSSLLLLLKRMNKSITGLEVKTSGDRREDHPTCFEKIGLEFTIHSPDLDNASVDKALALSKEKFCPVWAMINDKVVIETHYTIVP